jgi:hypothetical protein
MINICASASFLGMSATRPSTLDLFCHCAQADDPGHGPTLRLTYKVQGKTITEALPTSGSVRKAEREIAEFRNFQELSRSLLDVNEKICRLRPVEEQPQSEQEKKRRTPSNRKSRAK